MQFLASRGGLRPDAGGELKSLGLTGKSRVVVPGMGFRSLVHAKGMGLDQAREAAVEAGYIEDTGFRGPAQATSTTRDLLDKLAEGLRGNHTYPVGSEGMVAEAQARHEREAAEDQLASQREEIAQALAEVGESIDAYDAKDIERAAALVAKGLDPVDALERAVMQVAVEDGLDTVEAIEEDYGAGAIDAVQADSAPQPLPEGEQPAAQAETPRAGEAGAAEFGQADEIVGPEDQGGEASCGGCRA